MRIVIVIVFLLVALVGGFLVLKASGDGRNVAVHSGAPVASEVATVNVLVAREYVPMGTVIEEKMVDQQPWPRHLALEDFVISDAPQANVVGMVARADVQPNEPFSRSKLARPNDSSFLAASLPEGMRAVTLSVNAVTGVAGYVFPGDRVDVLVAHNIPAQLSAVGGRSNINEPKVAEVLVSNVRVIAVDVRNTAVQAQQRAQSGAVARPPENVTVEVSAEDVQRIRLAERNGSLSLALRSLKDREDVERVAPTALPAVSHFPVVLGDTVVVVRGTRADRPGADARAANAPLGFYVPGFAPITPDQLPAAPMAQPAAAPQVPQTSNVPVE